MAAAILGWQIPLPAVFFESRLCYGQDHCERRLSQRVWHLAWENCIWTGGETCQAPVVVLIDEYRLTIQCCPV